MTKAVFLGLSGPTLTPRQAAFFERVQPAGYILFARNVETGAQVAALTASLRDISGDSEVPVLIDQEGGRVRRLRPPLVCEHPAARQIGLLFEHDEAAALEAARLHGAAIGAELKALGVTVDCLPVLDLLFEDTHDIIGDRAFSRDPQVVARLGRAVMTGLGESGVIPVIKHIPGHGRAMADSHLELPVVAADKARLSEADFLPFALLNDAPMAMTAHILYSALDAEACATHSHVIINSIIRGDIGFDGLLMTDDLSMKALGGTMQSRAERALDAGCDIILHCNGDMAEMEAVVDAVPELAGPARARLKRALAWPARQTELCDSAAAAAQRDGLLKAVA